MSGRGTPVARTPVAIVGAGPVGLALALGLARHGVRSILLERNSTTSPHSRAAGIHVRTLEILRQWGVEHRVLAEGTFIDRMTLHDAGANGRALLALDFSALEHETERAGILMLEQNRTETVLLAAVRESGMCDVRFGAEVVALQTAAGLPTVTVRAGGAEYAVEADFVAGCDGAGSFVRRTLELPFEGITYSLRPLLADVRIRDRRDGLPWPRLRNERDGLTVALRLRNEHWRIIRLEPGTPDAPDEVTREEIGRRVPSVLGDGPCEVIWASRFRIHRRSSPRFRAGRVLLAGDAAHVHSPVGGQGMNLGVQDAHALAWRLGRAWRGEEVDRLLDGYDAERREVAVESVSRFTDVVTRAFLQAPAAVRTAALALLRTSFRIGAVRRRTLRRLTMIDLDYPPPRRTPRSRDRPSGMRLPDPRLRTPEGTEVRLYSLLSDDFTLIQVHSGSTSSASPPLPAAPAGAGIPEARARVAVVRIGPGDAEDPGGILRAMLGAREGWLLVRPDRHVAWTRRDPGNLRPVFD